MPTLPTELTLSINGLPPYSARGLRMTLTPIAQAQNLRRTINGDLVDLSEPSMQKYAATINGDDIDPPAIEGVWPGLTVTVGSIVELSEAHEEPTEGNTETEVPTELGISRAPVSGSVRYADGFLFYRPILVMKFVGFDVQRDEWPNRVSWSMQLEEI